MAEQILNKTSYREFAAAKGSKRTGKGRKTGLRPPAAGGNPQRGRGNMRVVSVRHARASQDYTLIAIVLFLIAFGLMMLYSTSSYEAALDFNGDSTHYLKRQAAATVVGIAVMVMVSYVPLKLWRRFSWWIYLFSLIMVILVYPFGTRVNGAKRWIYIGPVSIQPAEICKFAIIVLMAVNLSRVSVKILKSKQTTFLLLAPALVQAGAILVITTNLSSAAIVGVIAASMLFVTDDHYGRYFILLAGVAAVCVLAVVVAVQTQGSLTFRFKRILVWLDPAAYSDDTGYQVLQGLYGVGSGGIFGKGLGQSMQKLGYIPEAQNDMIFSIICEELGMFGAISIIMLFVILCWRIMNIANHAKSRYESLLAVGVMIHIAVQVILNIAVVTNSIPNTGVTLPFFSYGGSAIVILLAEIGLVLAVARNTSRAER